MMKQLFDLKILVLLLTLVSCQKLKPESVAIPEYPDFKLLMTDQVERLGKTKIRKEVWLDGLSEIQVIEMDSSKWMKELSFLREANPNQPEYVGAFEKSGDEFNQTLTLAKGEKGVLKKTSYSKNNSEYEKINSTIHEDRDVYVHHREIALNFKDGILSLLQIHGYQKMMFKDTVRFRIEITFN